MRVRRPVVLALSVLAISVTAACQSGGATSTSTGSATLDPNATLSMGLRIQNNQFDPAASPVTTDEQQLDMVYDRLLSQTIDGKIEGSLAESYEFKDNALVMKIRPNVKFQDGTALDADAVKINLDRNRGATLASSTLKTDLGSIKSVDVVDPMTVRVNLTKADVTIAALLSTRDGAIVSPKALSDGTNIGAKPVGAGPWKLTSFTPGVGQTLEAWDGYWNKSAVKVKKIDVKILPDAGSRLNAVRSGALDMAQLEAAQVSGAKAAGANVLVAPQLATTCFQVSNVTVPAYNDERVRKAINYAIDRRTIVSSVLAGQGQATSQVFPPVSIAFDKSNPDPYPYDVSKAKALLADAGYANGFEFNVLSGTTPSQTELEAVAGYLKAVNITMKVVHITGIDGVTQMWSQKTGQALAFPCNSVVDPSLNLANFLPNNFRNPGNLTNDDVTKLANESFITTDPAARTQVLQNVSKALGEHPLSIVPLWSNTSVFVLSKKVVGFEVPPTNFWQLTGVGKSAS